jgi:putative ABC transport system permease protein
MTLVTLAMRNVGRNRFRAVLTVAGVAVAIVAFVLLRTVVSAWNAGVEDAATDRIGTRHSVSFIMVLPRRYVDTIRGIDGIQSASWANWWGGRDPRHPDDFFATLAVDPESYLSVYDEITMPADQRAAWLADRRGALVGRSLAARLHVQAGDTLTLESPLSADASTTFQVDGVYSTTRRSFDESTLLFHWDLMNETRPAGRRDRVGWIISRVAPGSDAATVATAVDARFAQEDARTLSMSERAMNMSFLAMFSSVLDAIDVVSVLILVILLLILGNTVAMGVRERTNEYGVLRALGFGPGHVAMFIVGESILLGAFAGVLGLGLAYPLVNLGMGRFIEENMGGMFPFFRIQPDAAVLAMLFALALGAIAAAIPAWRASRLTTVEALRRVG